MNAVSERQICLEIYQPYFKYCWRVVVKSSTDNGGMTISTGLELIKQRPGQRILFFLQYADLIFFFTTKKQRSAVFGASSNSASRS
jgi:hypothetical protein